MKKIIPISLFVIICISHLNIIDAAIDIGTRYKQQDSVIKNPPPEEESEPQKESKNKEKAEEQEKYYTRNYHMFHNQSDLSDQDKFVCYSTTLNIHPYQDDDIQPPKAV